MFRHLLLLFLLLCLLDTIRGKLSIFLLGDSTSVLLYVDGLIPFFNCTKRNLEDGRQWEALNHFRYEKNRAMLCNGGNVDQIGYMFHWGVNSKKKYIKPWVHYRIQRQSLDSRANMDAAMKMFQGRMWKKKFRDENDMGIFIFNSLLWDVNRIPETNQTANDFYQEWKMDYISKVIELMRLVRPGKDELVLQTLHYLQRGHQLREHALRMNDIIVETAGMLRLPLLNLCNLIEDNDEHLTKGDYRHQNAQNSIMVAKQIGLRNWSYYRSFSVAI